MPEAALHVGSGKVRELYALDDNLLLLVASDRISTFDVVLPTEIPDKGRVLTGLSAFWFARTRNLCANHLVALRPDGRSTECRRLEMLPIECVVRDRARAAEVVGRDRLEEVERASIDLYRFAAGYARERGIVIADTKFEFGLDDEGRLVLADEVLTPDSSRFWPANEYRAGAAPPSFDKQFVRDYCESLGWDKAEPGPELPDDVAAGTRARYVEAFERLTAISFDHYLADPEVVLR